MPRYRVNVDDRWFDVDVGAWDGDRAAVTVDGQPMTVSLGSMAEAPAAAPAPVSTENAELDFGSDESANVLRSPLPGVIISVDVAVGQRVAAGARVCTMEAMKMEQSLMATAAGRVKAVRVKQGQSVLIGQTLVEFE